MTPIPMSDTEIVDSSYLYKSLNGQFNIDEAKGIVEAFVAGIGNKDSVNDICLPGCFTASLNRRKPRVVWGHNWNEPIGKVLEIYEVGPNDPRLPAKMRKAGIGGLYARVQFNLKSERGKEAFANVGFFGLEQEWSIGYKTLDAVFDPVQGANLLKEVELYEVSPVLHGANQLTATISIKSETAEMADKDGEKSAKQPLKDPKGGLTAAGRRHFKRTEGANLKPGVKGPADTPEKMRRKGSFLTRFFTNPSGPMKKPNGKPTRLALSAAAWGEPVPQDMADAAKLAAKGRRLLERYENSKKKKKDDVGEEVETKNHVEAIYAAYNSQSNETFGRASMLTRALSRHFGGPVRLVKADNDIAIFEMGSGSTTEMLRVAYHFDGDEFMFGTAQKVKPETVYIPVNENNAPTDGVAVSPATNRNIHPMIVAGVPSHSCCDSCASGKGSCDMPKSLASWEELSSKDDTERLLLAPESGEDPEELFEVMSEIGKYHGFDVKVVLDGVVVEGWDVLSDEATSAIQTAVKGLEQKAAMSMQQKARKPMNPFTAIDADGDMIVLEGIPTVNMGRGVPDPTPGGTGMMRDRNRAERAYDRFTERTIRGMERAEGVLGRLTDEIIADRRKRREDKFRRRGWLPPEDGAEGQMEPRNMPAVPKPDTAPIRKPERQPVRTPQKEPQKEPVRTPVEEPKIAPKKPERQPKRQPVREPVRQPVREPVREPARQPVPVPTREPVKVPVRQPKREKVPQYAMEDGATGEMTMNRPVPEDVRAVVQGVDMSPLIGGPGETDKRIRESVIRAANRVVDPTRSGDPMDPADRLASDFVNMVNQFRMDGAGVDDAVRSMRETMANMLGEIPSRSRRQQVQELFDSVLEKLTPEKIAMRRNELRERIRNAGYDQMRKLMNIDDGTTDSFGAAGAMADPQDRSERDEMGRRIWLERTHDGSTLDDVASKYRISREQARQMELAHSQKLRNMGDSHPNRIGRMMLDDPASTLTDQETDLLKRRFDGELLEESAKRLRLNRNAVRRMEQLALAKLRDSMVAVEGASGDMRRSVGGEAAEAVRRPKGRSLPATGRRPDRIDPSIREIMDSLQSSGYDYMSRPGLVKLATMMRLKRIVSNKVDAMMVDASRRERRRVAALAAEADAMDDVYKDGFQTQSDLIANSFGSVEDFAGLVMKRANGEFEPRDLDSTLNARAASQVEDSAGDVYSAASSLGMPVEVVRRRAMAHSMLLSAMRTPDTIRTMAEVEADQELLNSRQKRLAKLWMNGFTIDEIAEVVDSPRDEVGRELGRVVRKLTETPDYVPVRQRRRVVSSRVDSDESGTFSELTLSDGTVHKNYLSDSTFGSAAGNMASSEVVTVSTPDGDESYAINRPKMSDGRLGTFTIAPIRTRNREMLSQSMAGRASESDNFSSLAMVVADSDGRERLMAGAVGDSSAKRLTDLGEIISRVPMSEAIESNGAYAGTLLSRYDALSSSLDGAPESQRIRVARSSSAALAEVAEKIRNGEAVDAGQLLDMDANLASVESSLGNKVRHLPHHFDTETSTPTQMLSGDRRYTFVDDESGEIVNYAKRAVGEGTPNKSNYYLRVADDGSLTKWNHPYNTPDFSAHGWETIRSWPDSQVGDSFLASDERYAIASAATGYVPKGSELGAVGRMDAPGEGIDYVDEDGEIRIKSSKLDEASLGGASYLALSQDKPLVFSYAKPSELPPGKLRRVKPIDLFRGDYDKGSDRIVKTGRPDDPLYLKAIDLDKQQVRTFRVARMSSTDAPRQQARSATTGAGAESPVGEGGGPTTPRGERLGGENKKSFRVGQVNRTGLSKSQQSRMIVSAAEVENAIGITNLSDHLDALNDEKHPQHESAMKMIDDLGNKTIGDLLMISDTGTVRKGFGGKKPRRRRYRPWGGDVGEDLDKLGSWADLGKWLNENDYVIYDFETTGIVEETGFEGEPIQLTMHVFSKGKKVDSRTWFINPMGQKLSDWSKENTSGPNGQSMTDELAATFPSPDQVASEIMELLGDSSAKVMIGHNIAGFDNAVLQRLMGPTFKTRGWIDTLALADALFVGEKARFAQLSKLKVEIPNWFKGRDPLKAGKEKNTMMAGAIKQLAKIDGHRALIGPWKEAKTGTWDDGRPKMVISSSTSLEALRDYFGLRLGKKQRLHNTDADTDMTKAVLDGMIERGVNTGLGSHIFEPEVREKLESFAEREYGVRMTSWEAMQQKLNFGEGDGAGAYGSAGTRGGGTDEPRASGARTASAPGGGGGRRPTPTQRVSMTSRPDTRVIGRDPSAPISYVYSSGRYKAIVDYEFNELDLNQRRQALANAIGSAMTEGWGMEFVYGTNPNGTPRTYEIFGVEMRPIGERTVAQARAVGFTAFRLHGITKQRESLSFSLDDIGNYNAPDPEASDYVPTIDYLLKQTEGDINKFTAIQYQDWTVRMDARNRDSGGATGRMAGLNNPSGGNGGTSYWLGNKYDREMRNSSGPELREAITSARRSFFDAYAKGPNANTEMMEALDRMSAAERLLATASGSVVDETGLIVTRSPDGDYSLSGSANISKFKLRSGYGLPKGNRRRRDIARNSSISSEFDRVINSAPRGTALSSLARNLGMNRDEVAARLESHDFETYGDALYVARVAELSRLVANDSITLDSAGVTIPDGSNLSTAMARISRAMSSIGASGFGASGSMASSDGSDADKYKNMDLDELLVRWNRAIANLFAMEVDGQRPRNDPSSGRVIGTRGSRGRYGDTEFAARAKAMKQELRAISDEIRRRFFANPEAQAAIKDILGDDGASGQMSSGGDLPVISGSQWLDSRLFEIYGERDWENVARSIGKRFSDMETRDWSSPTDDDLVDLHHYVQMLAHDSIIEIAVRQGDFSVSGGDVLSVTDVISDGLYGVDKAVAVVATRLGIPAQVASGMVASGAEIAEVRQLAAMSPFDRVEAMSLARSRRALANLFEMKKEELGDRFGDWLAETSLRNLEMTTTPDGRPLSEDQLRFIGGRYAGFFGRNYKEVMQEMQRALDFNPSGGASGEMGRNFIPPRYDIKPHQGGWVIIDTANRNAISSRVFTDRLEALRGAKRMDKGDRNFNPYGASGSMSSGDLEMPSIAKKPDYRKYQDNPVSARRARAAMDAYDSGMARLPTSDSEANSEWRLIDGWMTSNNSIDTILWRLSYLGANRDDRQEQVEQKQAEIRRLVSYLGKLRKRRDYFRVKLAEKFRADSKQKAIASLSEANESRNGIDLELDDGTYDLSSLGIGQ